MDFLPLLIAYIMYRTCNAHKIPEELYGLHYNLIFAMVMLIGAGDFLMI